MGYVLQGVMSESFVYECVVFSLFYCTSSDVLLCFINTDADDFFFNRSEDVFDFFDHTQLPLPSSTWKFRTLAETFV